MEIPFNRAYHFREAENLVLEALRSNALCGNKSFGKKCIELLQERYGFKHVFLTPSCTAAMEMGAIVAGIGPGDEVILPSYTFSSTANAIVLRGAKPIFCDVDPATMNIDAGLIENLISDKTKMILPIDYAGIPCDIEKISAIADKHKLRVMVDAAQSFHSFYRGRACGTHFPLAAFSFHETKNTSCGEGGALIVNDEELVERAIFAQEKGTDRSLVLLGMKNKYSWVSEGSSFLLADLLAAVLFPQLEQAELIVAKRAQVTEAYKELFAPFEDRGLLQTPKTPEQVGHNHHAFFVIFEKEDDRTTFISELRERDVRAYIGYVPLHSSPMGQSLGYKPEDVPLTESISKRIVRLPFYTELAENGLEYCVSSMDEVLRGMYGSGS